MADEAARGRCPGNHSNGPADDNGYLGCHTRPRSAIEKMLIRHCCAIVVGWGTCWLLAASTAWAGRPYMGSTHDLDITFGTGYLNLDNSLDCDLTLRDRVGVAMAVIPEQSWGSLSFQTPERYDEVSGAARHRRLNVAPHYVHQWNKDWLPGAEYEYANWDCESLFHNHVGWGHTVTGFVEFGGFQNMSIDFGVGFNTTRPPAGTEFGLEVGRSFTEVIVGTGLRFDLPRHWKAKIGTEYHLRDYTTDLQPDSAYLDRRDNLWTIGAEMGRRFRNHLRVELQAGYGHRDSNRSDPAVAADEIGYAEYMVGLTGEWPF